MTRGEKTASRVGGKPKRVFISRFIGLSPSLIFFVRIRLARKKTVDSSGAPLFVFRAVRAFDTA